METENPGERKGCFISIQVTGFVGNIDVDEDYSFDPNSNLRIWRTWASFEQ
jgi:hypothetical protein